VTPLAWLKIITRPLIYTSDEELTYLALGNQTETDD